MASVPQQPAYGTSDRPRKREMASQKIGTFGTGQTPWQVPSDDEARQAIAPLRGYVYQIHRSMSAWLALREHDELHLEIAEDFAEVLKDPSQLDEVLKATQVKDTRESGSVTLNSTDVLDAIGRLFALSGTNPGREVRLSFLTTSPIGKERKNALPSGQAAIAVWQEMDPANVGELRAALAQRFYQGEIGDFIRKTTDAELRNRLLDRLEFVCGAADWKHVSAENRKTLVKLRDQVGATEEAAERAYDFMLCGMIDTVLGSPDRRLDRTAFLSTFKKATVISVPSQTYENLVSQATTPKSGPAAPTEDRLRTIAQALLDANAPPSIAALVGTESAQARAALDGLSSIEREIVEDNRPVGDQSRSFRTIGELVESPALHNIIVAAPGSGKTHALWRVAANLLGQRDLIPIYLAAGGVSTWRALRDSILDIDPTIDAMSALRQPKVIMFVDGWGEFADGAVAERKAAARAIHNIRVIANGRQRNASDTSFKSWTLQPFTPSLVRSTLEEAFGAKHQIDANFVDLLRIPLLLVLYIALGGASVTRGELLHRLHDQVSNGMPEAISEALFGTAAAMTLAGDTDYASLLAGLRARASKTGLEGPVALLDRLGTLTDRSGRVLPIHDLYWSWLAGMGYLHARIVQDALPDLKTRESFKLAFESRERSDVDMVSASAPSDAVFAAALSVNVDATRTSPVLDKQLDGMLAATDLAVRVRGAIAGLQTRRSRFLRPALDILSELSAPGMHSVELLNAFDVEIVFQNRAALADWLGVPGTTAVLDIIARAGGPEWLGWLEEMQRSNRLDPELALSAALACGDFIPDWGRPHLEGLIKNGPWRLRTAAERATNQKLARWIADNYGDIVDRLLNPNTGGWWSLNRLLVTVGDDGIFQDLLQHFPGMSPKAQELLGFAVIEKGSAWIARFQRSAFAASDIRHHHQLANEVSLEIDDQTARSWIAAGHDAVGWRVLIARHGSSMVPELIAGLPASFDGLHDVPTLSAMSFLTEAPETIIAEITSRVRGTMQPKVMQDVIEAIAKVQVTGLPEIVKRFAAPSGLPTYHVVQVLRLYVAWKRTTGVDLEVGPPTGGLPFREFALMREYYRRQDPDMLARGFGFAPDVAIRFVLSTPGPDTPYAKKILESLEPLESLDRALLQHMMAIPDLTSEIPTLFAEVIDEMSADELLALATSPHVDFNLLLWRTSTTSNPMHRAFHLDAMKRTLATAVNLHNYGYIGSMLRAYSRDDMKELLGQPPLDVRSDKVLWLIRAIEDARRERLINEAGEVLE